MSSLKDRLKRLTGSGSGTGGGNDSGEPVPLTDADNAIPEEAALPILEQEQTPSTIAAASYAVEALDAEWQKLDAALVRNEWGSFIRRRRLFPFEHLHGDYRLADLYGCAGELAAFHREEKSIGAGELLFFDTETTGLGVGAGTVPFMVGLGFWEEEGFAVEQLFIRNPAEELAMLAYLKLFMQRYPYLVTYNGRTFDWPLLLNRFVMNRMKDGIPDPKHLDFLYPSRSLWKNTLPSCRLGKVEEARLGFQRIDDTPGSMAPTLYFLYLAEKKPGVMGPVFLHNELDILSLAGLAVLFARTLSGTNAFGSGKAEEKYRLGIWLHKMGKPELSRQVLKELLAKPVSEDTSSEAVPLYTPLAAHFKQIGAWDEAVELWQRAIMAGKLSGASMGPPLEPYVELSMYFEHRVKDYASALLYAEEALDWAERRHEALQAVRRRSGRKDARKRSVPWGEGPMLPKEDVAPDRGSGPTGIGELEKRIRRLRSKQLRADGRDSDPSPVSVSEEAVRTSRKASSGKDGQSYRKRRPASSNGIDHETITLF